jgi:hypothetical protein
MSSPFALFCRTLAVPALVAGVSLAALAQAPEPAPTVAPPQSDNGTLPAGGKFRECHGYIRHVSDLNIKVHCIDGNASDQSFLYTPKYVSLKDGKSVQTRDLAPETPVTVYYTQSLGIKKAYKIFVVDPQGNGVSGFRS